MVAVVTYDLRSGYLGVVASGRSFRVSTYQEPGRIAAWKQLRRAGARRRTLWDHCFEIPPRGGLIQESMPVGRVIHKISVEQGDNLDVYDYPGTFADKRPDEADPQSAGVRHTFQGKAVFVGCQSGGVHIHGWPPCNIRQCVIVMERWDEMLHALAREKELSFSIEY